MLHSRPKVTDVFTPRDKDVNTEMYVERPGLERALIRSINGSFHTLLFGESGNGKSWLYKHVFSQQGIKYVVANCSNASRFKSVTEAIFNASVPSDYAEKTGFEETKEAKVTAVFAEGAVNHQATFEIKGEEKLEKAFRIVSEKNSNHPVVIVLENLESIFKDSALMQELANIILLLDDQRYAKFKVKFLIVGVPNGVLEFFSKVLNLESVSNRIEELPKVGGFESIEVVRFVEKGFKSKLKVQMSSADISKVSKHVHNITLGIAQRIHEYCVALGHLIEDTEWKFSVSLLKDADSNWLKQGLRSSYSVIESHMNSKETTVGRRNQVIFAIGKISSHQIHSSDIEELIHKEFPATVPQTNMGITAILSELCKSGNPLLQKSDSSNAFVVKDPRYIMCIRVMLFKDSDSRVQKRGFKL